MTLVLLKSIIKAFIRPNGIVRRRETSVVEIIYNDTKLDGVFNYYQNEFFSSCYNHHWCNPPVFLCNHPTYPVPAIRLYTNVYTINQFDFDESVAGHSANTLFLFFI